MDAPTGRQSETKFNAEIQRFLDTKCKKNLDGDYECRKCQTEIQQVTCYVSIHDARFNNCAGGGECTQVPLPYCPRCEGKPKNTSTCVHV